MDLKQGEIMHSSALVQADDTSETAFLFLTDQRLVIEFSNRREAAVAAITAAVRGEPVPLAMDAHLREILAVRALRRTSGPPVLKITMKEGRVTLWLTYEAHRLASDIEQRLARYRMGSDAAPETLRG
jgi:hypothetical protein